MSANTIFILVLVGFFFVSLVLQAASLRWGLRWAQVAEVSLLKALGLFFVFFFAGLIAAALAAILFVAILYVTSIDVPDVSDQACDILGYAIHILAACIVIMWLYKVRFFRALKSIMPHVLVSAAVVLLLIFGLRPFAYEGFLIPTNGMAPTILGEHWEAQCPRCGAAAYGAPLDPGMPAPPGGFQMICSRERTSVLVANSPTETREGDRILVCKFIKPRRWDLIVFRYPEDPGVNYLKRLVGLPGEKLEIREGAIWINGEKLEPPASVAGTRYSPTIEWNGQVHSGPGSQPVELGRDEYFVLGDFVEQSSDSRFWQRGAPGHPPYAVPESHIVGVVINIYWPINRWTSFR
jgi:signal peptidase I